MGNERLSQVHEESFHATCHCVSIYSCKFLGEIWVVFFEIALDFVDVALRARNTVDSNVLHPSILDLADARLDDQWAVATLTFHDSVK